MGERAHVIVRAKVLVEVTLSGTWSPDETAKHLDDVGRREALNALSVIFQNDPGRFKVVGTPEVVFTTYGREGVSRG